MDENEAISTRFTTPKIESKTPKIESKTTKIESQTTEMESTMPKIEFPPSPTIDPIVTSSKMPGSMSEPSEPSEPFEKIETRIDVTKGDCVGDSASALAISGDVFPEGEVDLYGQQIDMRPENTWTKTLDEVISTCVCCF